MTHQQALAFGAFEFDVARSLLFRAGAPVPLGQRGAALLSVLLLRRGEVLTKTELIDAAWPGLVVEEANLSVQMSLLRRALGRTAGGGDWIATVHHVGYRFVPAFEAVVSVSPVPKLAVLPFTDFDTGSQSQADGLVEDLTTVLARYKSIGVVARNSSFDGNGRTADIPQLARRLGVGYVLEGSLRRIGGRLRANVQLIDGRTGTHLWADTVDQPGQARNPADPLANKVAAMVEAQIQAAETSRARTERPESASAYDLYLRARWLLRPSEEKGNAEAHGLLQRALQVEPENIHILAAAAETLHHRISVGWPAIGPDDGKVMLDLTRRGLGLGIDDGASLGLFSNALFTVREWDEGRVTMERAIEANPNSSMALVCAGLCCQCLGLTDEAEGYHARAASQGLSDPNRRFALQGLATVQRRRGNYEAAMEFAKQAIAIGPALSAAHWNLIVAAVCLGRRDDARRYLARYRSLSPQTTIATIRKGQSVVDERLLEKLLDGLAAAGLPEA